MAGKQSRQVIDEYRTMYKYVLISMLALGACAPLQQTQSSLAGTEHNAAAADGSTGSIAYPPRPVVQADRAAPQTPASEHAQAGAGFEE